MPNKNLSGAQQADKKNSKIFAIIAIVAFIVLHLLAIELSKEPLHNMNIYPLLWALPILAAASLVWTLKSVLQLKDVTEDNKWPYIVLIALSFASAVAIGYCSTC